VPNSKKPRNPCLFCGKEPAYAGYKYCSNTCQHEFQHKLYIKKWLRGETIGLQRHGVVSVHIKRYLREKYNNKCCLCGWSAINQTTGKVPLVADHIDGDWRNNIESNLRLICPNCDALSPTYAALNRGNGRKGRVVSNRIKEGRLLIDNASNNSLM